MSITFYVRKLYKRITGHQRAKRLLIIREWRAQSPMTRALQRYYTNKLLGNLENDLLKNYMNRIVPTGQVIHWQRYSDSLGKEI